MEQQNAYANKYTIARSEREIFISFQWIVPTLNEEGNVTGQQVNHDQTITMPIELAYAMKDSLNTLLKEHTDGADSE